MIQKYSAKDYLEQSAQQLLAVKGIDRVTVKDICENCGVSTRTFYKYYRDKYDVINTCFNDELENFYRQHQGPISLHPFIFFTTDIVNEHLDFYGNVFRYTGQNNIRRYLVIPLSEHYLRIIRDYCHAEITQEIRDAVTFYLQGQLAFVEEALTRAQIPDSSTSVAFFENAIPALLQPFL